MLELCRYVVLNPIRAGMVKKIERYAWSSYPATLGFAVRPAWLATDWLLGQFAKTASVARRRYAQFVAEGGSQPSPWIDVRGQALLGSEDFVEKLRPMLEGARELKEIPRSQRLLHRPSLAKMFPKVVQGDKVLRDAAIRQACLEYGHSMAKISLHAGVHYSTVSKVIKGERESAMSRLPFTL